MAIDVACPTSGEAYQAQNVTNPANPVPAKTVAMPVAGPGVTFCVTSASAAIPGATRRSAAATNAASTARKRAGVGAVWRSTFVESTTTIAAVPNVSGQRYRVVVLEGARSIVRPLGNYSGGETSVGAVIVRRLGAGGCGNAQPRASSARPGGATVLG